MGQVFKANQGLVRDYPEEANATYTEAVINPGQSSAAVSLAAFSRVEATVLLLKLDALVSQLNNALIGTIVAENAEAIMIAVRMTKEQSKGQFAGILGGGNMMDIKWLRPKDIGSPLLRGVAAAGALGIYGQVPLAAGTFTWLRAVVENTAQFIVPSQTMDQFAGCIHLGAIEPIEVPKISDITFILGGLTTPAQSINQNIKSTFGNTNTDIQVTRFEKPVIVGPLSTQQIAVMPAITGDTRFQLLSFLIARASVLVA